MSSESEMKCFIAGLGLGAAAAVLFAPKSGAQSREYLQSKTQKGADFLKNQAASAMNVASDAVERGSNVLRQQKESVAAAVEAGKAAYSGATAGASARDVRN